MSIVAGQPDLMPEEQGRTLRRCAEAGHHLLLFREGGALHVNWAWQGRALGVGCPECDFALFVPLSAEDENELAKALARPE